MKPNIKRVTSAVRQWAELFGVPVVLLVSLVAAMTLVATEVASPLPLEESIDDVLTAPATQTASTPSPAASTTHGTSSRSPNSNG
jgi:hypothetical protein